MQPPVPDEKCGTGLPSSIADGVVPSSAESHLPDERARFSALEEPLLAMLEGERRRLARTLHDDAGQILMAIKFYSQALRHATHEKDCRSGLDEIAQLADSAISRLRELSAGMWPPPLESVGLEAALRWQAAEMFHGRDELLELKFDGLQQRLLPEVELALFRIGQESLANVIQHARASRVEIRLRLADGCVVLGIADDGCGFPAIARGSGGIRLMRLRAQIVGGELSIEAGGNQPDGNNGTLVMARVPISGRRVITDEAVSGSRRQGSS